MYDYDSYFINITRPLIGCGPRLKPGQAPALKHLWLQLTPAIDKRSQSIACLSGQHTQNNFEHVSIDKTHVNIRLLVHLTTRQPMHIHYHDIHTFPMYIHILQFIRHNIYLLTIPTTLSSNQRPSPHKCVVSWKLRIKILVINKWALPNILIHSDHILILWCWIVTWNFNHVPGKQLNILESLGKNTDFYNI